MADMTIRVSIGLYNLKMGNFQFMQNACEHLFSFLSERNIESTKLISFDLPLINCGMPHDIQKYR
jgi:hypothetical protein